MSECNLALIVHNLLQGQTLVFPTETSYGLGCDASNQQAVDRIFDIKGRRSDKPLLVVVPSIEEAKKYLIWNDLLKKIADTYWPGPLTVVGTYIKKPGVDRLAMGVVSQENTLAVRVTPYPLLRSITSKLGKPLVATSANVADAGDAYSAADIIKAFQARPMRPDAVLDYGTLLVQKPTTIVSVTQNTLRVLRQGDVVVAL